MQLIFIFGLFLYLLIKITVMIFFRRTKKLKISKRYLTYFFVQRLYINVRARVRRTAGEGREKAGAEEERTGSEKKLDRRR